MLVTDDGLRRREMKLLASRLVCICRRSMEETTSTKIWVEACGSTGFGSSGRNEAVGRG